tara:strand:- start:531 stop:1205 length:675 start_codon:yes stop_codon:yes gene_type:complete
MEVNIKNKKLLNQLDGFKDEFFSIKGYDDKKHWRYSKEEHLNRGEYFCSEDHLNFKLSEKETHSGFPEEHFAQPISSMVKNDPDKFLGFRNKVKNDFAVEIGAMHSALLNYYPPGGFVGWHTNWNANCYQILFTWSKSGKGYFKYLDNETDKIVTIHDVPGWQCRYYYFGRKDEIDNHCWHSAYAGEDRITLAYKFENKSLKDPANAGALMLRDQLIEEIESED